MLIGFLLFTSGMVLGLGGLIWAFIEIVKE
nr:MAG TPA: transmembrane protein [Caudoviricetes sp.]